MKRLAMGAAVGSLAAYLFDPKLGAERRERLYSVWQDNKDTAVQAGKTASRAVESARPVALRVTKAVGAGDWAKALEPRRRSSSLPKLVGAVAVGGALMYFLDPTRGSARRQAAVAKGRQVATRVVEVAKTVPNRVGASSTDSGSRASRVS